MKKIIVISDQAADALNTQEFLTAIEGYSKVPKDVRLTFVASSPSTIHTGFLLSQLTYTEERLGRPNETLIFLHTDPRLQADHTVDVAKGAQFLIARLASGVYICGPNAGNVFSFVKPQIEELFEYSGMEDTSQLRSRDTLSRVVAHLADYMEDELQLQETHIHLISDIEKGLWYIGHIDNFGTLKITMTSDDLKGSHSFGDNIKISIGHLTRDAKYVEYMFAGHPGELVIFPGSTGRTDNPNLEISVWRHFEKGDHHNGAHAFDYPRPGEIVKIV